MGFRPLAFAASLAVFGSANASISVWLDYAGFDTNIVSAWTSGGYSGGNALSAAEILGIKNDVQTKLQGIYSGFSVNFSQTNPGGIFETLRMGATTGTSGLYGQAERIDWRNRFKDDVAEIYAHNFGDVVFTGSFTRAQNLERIKNSLANTTAHELGHNLGLQHYDPYGVDTIQAPSYVVTGQQNNQIMATGSTGLTSMSRGVLRSFGVSEKVKLEYADGVPGTNGTTINESAGAKGSTATAQAITGDYLSISQRTGVNVAGRLTNSNEFDFYRFESTAGTLITANTFSGELVNPAGGTVDTIITLHDAAGNTLFSNDDIGFSGNSFLQNGNYGTESLIQNFVATYTGTYYLSVTGWSGDTGSYELLLTGLNPVPEPATMAALGAGVLWMARRRRAKKA